MTRNVDHAFQAVLLVGWYWNQVILRYSADGVRSKKKRMTGRGKGGKVWEKVAPSGIGRFCVIISKELRNLPSDVWHAEVE